MERKRRQCEWLLIWTYFVLKKIQRKVISFWKCIEFSAQSRRYRQSLCSLHVTHESMNAWLKGMEMQRRQVKDEQEKKTRRVTRGCIWVTDVVTQEEERSQETSGEKDSNSSEEWNTSQGRTRVNKIRRLRNDEKSERILKNINHIKNEGIISLSTQKDRRKRIKVQEDLSNRSFLFSKGMQGSSMIFSPTLSCLNDLCWGDANSRMTDKHENSERQSISCTFDTKYELSVVFMDPDVKGRHFVCMDSHLDVNRRRLWCKNSLRSPVLSMETEQQSHARPNSFTSHVVYVVMDRVSREPRITVILGDTVQTRSWFPWQWV